MQSLNKVFLGLIVFVGVLALGEHAKAEPVTRTIVWDSANPAGTLYTAYRDGVEIPECVDVTDLNCAAALEPGVAEYCVKAHNDVWESECSAPFLSPSVPDAPFSLGIAR